MRIVINQLISMLLVNTVMYSERSRVKDTRVSTGSARGVPWDAQDLPSGDLQFHRSPESKDEA